MMNCISLSSKAIYANNNKGSALFEAGRFDEAKHAFQQSLELIRDAAVLLRQANNKKASSRHRDLPKGGSVSFYWSEIPVRISSVESKTISGAQNNPPVAQLSPCASFIFRRATIMIEPTSFRTRAAEYRAETFAVVYNLALVCHCMAIEQNSDVLVKQAIRFYKLALQNATQCPRGNTTSSLSERKHDDKSGMIMAIMNNLGQLYFDYMLDFDIADHCFQQILVALHGEQVLVDERGEDTTENGFNKEDISGFLRNIILERPLLSAAA